MTTIGPQKSLRELSSSQAVYAVIPCNQRVDDSNELFLYCKMDVGSWRQLWNVPEDSYIAVPHNQQHSLRPAASALYSLLVVDRQSVDDQD